ncbi:M24 family metallopeptidase [Fusobacterium sp. PH5-44]|uniref:M24 family metallopeptidase n=1 Tax=unclassified Fusobacterium TaxID=2648384 RepID=UPI003D1E3654
MIEARNRVFSIIEIGRTFEELYLSCSEIFKKNGFERYLPGRIGHGIGLSFHEYPSISIGNKIPLSSGMVFTIEPGIMDKEFGGVRHSDTIHITENGFEFSNNLNRDKWSIIID